MIRIPRREMPTGDPAAGRSDVTRFTGKPPPGPPPHPREGWPPPKRKQVALPGKVGKETARNSREPPYLLMEWKA